MTQAPANWYPDPVDPTLFRYWDGSRWTEHTSPRVQGPQPGAAHAAAPWTQTQQAYPQAHLQAQAQPGYLRET